MRVLNRKVQFVTFAVLLFLSGFVSSYILRNRQQGIVEKQYPLLAKRVQIQNPNQPRVNFTDLRKQLESYVSQKSSSNQQVSLYFEYLPTGVSISINQNNESIGASLMKVPVVMTLYRLTSEGKIDLDKKVALKESWLNSEYGTLYQKGAGYGLTIREAARLTLKDSDNTAILLIFDQLNGIDQNETAINFLDLEYDVTNEERVLISAQSYSSILKCLYVACYNSLADSQEILGYLAESIYDERLTKLLPEDLVVAHKIGTFSEQYQSDCGIFYVENRNYLLCVMVEGDDESASPVIATISDKIYTYISNLPKE